MIVWTMLKGLLRKYWMYLAAGGLVIVSVLGYGSWRYHVGKRDCQTAFVQAQLDASELRNKEQAKQAQDALKKEKDLNAKISALKTEKQKAQDEARKKAIEANRPGSCDLSPDELQSFRDALQPDK